MPILVPHIVRRKLETSTIHLRRSSRISRNPNHLGVRPKPAVSPKSLRPYTIRSENFSTAPLCIQHGPWAVFFYPTHQLRLAAETQSMLEPAYLSLHAGRSGLCLRRQCLAYSIRWARYKTLTSPNGGRRGISIGRSNLGDVYHR
jgi:hypothetical protein